MIHGANLTALDVLEYTQQSHTLPMAKQNMTCTLYTIHSARVSSRQFFQGGARVTYADTREGDNAVSL